MRVKLVIAGVAALAVSLAMAAPSLATIRVQKGISGVYIGMTQSQMRAQLGEPIHTRQGLNDFGPFTQFVFPGRIAVSFQGNDRVTSIYTSSRTQKTSDGVGVGSAERSVLRHVDGVKCQTIAHSRSCYVGKFRAGRRVTVFKITKGHVARVTIGIVID